MRRLLAIGLLSGGISAQAAIPVKKMVGPPQKILSGQNAVTGGAAGSGFSLTNVTLAKTPGKERVILDVGDLQGMPHRGFPAYYHAELRENPRRLILDFAQMPNVLVDEKALHAKLRGSTAISNSTILIDPTDQTLSLVLDLRKNVKAEVFQVAGKKGTSRVVVDLQ